MTIQQTLLSMKGIYSALHNYIQSAEQVSENFQHLTDIIETARRKFTKTLKMNTHARKALTLDIIVEEIPLRPKNVLQKG